MKSIWFLLALSLPVSAQQSWQFAVAGDSRNCGDVVMPSIANSVKATAAQFYWHLGDFRKISDFDDDMLAAAQIEGTDLEISDYYRQAWPDFITHQANRFQVPVYLGIGNHETTSPKTKPEWTLQFADWLTRPNIVQQRLADNPNDHLLRAYYHWIQNGVDFWNLDNADYSFDSEQMKWISNRMKYVLAHPEIRTVIAGSHAALPHSLSCDHSMNQTANGERNGVIVYKQLLELQKAGKKVYLFASHSHYKLENIFDTDYWHNNGGVLPGWIVGTAGAQRYRLPDTAAGMPASRAQTDVYGYYLVTVAADGSITVDFRQVKRADVPPDVEQVFGAAGIDRCYAGNKELEHVGKSANCAANVPCSMP
ncbi:MAG TPA: hypothetical protein VII75_16105 [Thermoanaerobaculia bacterium]|nr:hypothetical protein [Thermoanaerobaculia bacterium]